MDNMGLFLLISIILWFILLFYIMMRAKYGGVLRRINGDIFILRLASTLTFISA